MPTYLNSLRSDSASTEQPTWHQEFGAGNNYSGIAHPWAPNIWLYILSQTLSLHWNLHSSLLQFINMAKGWATPPTHAIYVLTNSLLPSFDWTCAFYNLSSSVISGAHYQNVQVTEYCLHKCSLLQPRSDDAWAWVMNCVKYHVLQIGLQNDCHNICVMYWVSYELQYTLCHGCHGLYHGLCHALCHELWHGLSYCKSKTIKCCE